MKISIIIPVHNEEDSLKELHQEILDVIDKDIFNSEIIYINDGSTDNSLEKLKELRKAKIISFRKRFGQTAALDAGFKNSKGEYVITLDGDGQNDPSDIPRLFKKMKEDNLDCISGWRKVRKDSLGKKIISKVGGALKNLIANDGIHDSGCTLKIYKRECVENLDLYGEMHRFIPSLLVSEGFKVGEIEVNHRERKNGDSKYGISRGIKGFLDMISIQFWRKFVNRPLHLFGAAGIFTILIAITSVIFLIFEKINYGTDLSDTILTDIALFGFVIGVQFIIFGLLADMVSKIYFTQDRHESYKIKEIIENE